MLEQIKDLCLFMICGQTLLYFQSGKKYEKICRMILELLILAGIVGMLLNFLQSLGLQKGEMEAGGSAVAGMRRSMEEALSKQLGSEAVSGEFFSDNEMASLIERYTENEIKSRYNYFAEQYGYVIHEVKQQDEKLQVFLKESKKKAEENDEPEKSADERNPAKIVEIEQIEVEDITLEEEEKSTEVEETDKEHGEKSRTPKEELKTFRRQFALVLAMEEEKLEVILID